MGDADSLAWLEQQAIPIVAHHLVSNSGEAANVAGDIGFPVVMRITTGVHKSDAGGAVTDIGSPEEAADTYGRLAQSGWTGNGPTSGRPSRTDRWCATESNPAASGILVEVVHDTPVAMAPVSADEADALVARTPCGHPPTQGPGRRAAHAWGDVVVLLVRVSEILERPAKPGALAEALARYTDLKKRLGGRPSS